MYSIVAMKKLNIAIIFGGRSGEHEVSLVSASSVINALDNKKYTIIPIGITKDGLWFSGKNVLGNFKKGQFKKLSKVILGVDPKKPGILIGNKYVKVDVVFPVLHGPYGEDGTIQGMLEMAGLPYVGCGVLASSLAMDKFVSKMVFASYGLPQANFVQVTRKHIDRDIKKVVKLVTEKIGYPCFVKPSNMGSSVGISKVKKQSQLAYALRLAADFDSSIIIEEGINAREIECAVLGNDDLIASVAGEIIPSREFYDYYAKYVDNSSKLLLPSPISEEKMLEVKDLATKAFRAISGSGMGRVDFLMDKKTGKLYLNEINTIPGFTSISMYPKLMAASGIPYTELLDRLIKLAIERYKEKLKNKVSFDSGSSWYK
jgi:D-alanine-D-alanine ligase